MTASFLKKKFQKIFTSRKLVISPDKYLTCFFTFPQRSGKNWHLIKKTHENDCNEQKKNFLSKTGRSALYLGTPFHAALYSGILHLSCHGMLQFRINNRSVRRIDLHGKFFCVADFCVYIGITILISKIRQQKHAEQKQNTTQDKKSKYDLKYTKHILFFFQNFFEKIFISRKFLKFWKFRN